MCAVGLAPLPALGTAAPMHHGQHNDPFRLDPVIDSEGEAVCQGASNASMHDGVVGGLLSYGQKGALNLVEEFRPPLPPVVADTTLPLCLCLVRPQAAA